MVSDQILENVQWILDVAEDILVHGHPDVSCSELTGYEHGKVPLEGISKPKYTFDYDLSVTGQTTDQNIIYCGLCALNV